MVSGPAPLPDSPLSVPLQIISIPNPSSFCHPTALAQEALE